MTAFNPSDIPPSVTTLEQLAVWSIDTLNHLYPTTYALVEGRTQDLAIASAVVGNTPSNDSPTPYLYLFSFRGLLPLTSDYRLYGNNWEGAISLGNSVIPAFFTT